MTKREFVRHAMNLRISAKAWRAAVEKALRSGCIDYESASDYSGVYPLAAAIMEDRLDWYLNGSPYENVRRKMRREANNIRRFL